MHDPQIMVMKAMAFKQAEKLAEKEPKHELLKYAKAHQIFWEEFLARFGSHSVNHAECVAQAYNKYYLVLKKMNQVAPPTEETLVSDGQLTAEKFANDAEFHNSLGYY